jgi:chromosome segregation protein
MLRALELHGFKSFADKTRLDFPPGITVVVGPNGSGKSNVVDAIKWVLGEQSVKSLRGKEMVDVIFNGSSSRKPLNTAEVTLTFDNRDRRLAVETPEVHITRRVYRSGEGEYLINKQACRLRDIRDLFAGTGIATEAYSVIEQGKVDVLLQSSPKDRRLIFEEAAGISRFKAKKVETIRRLERVEQNLIRLRDIVDEVESRLRAVRLQAGKARRYQEYAGRLQELRTHVGLVDWRRLTADLTALESEMAAIQEEMAASVTSAERAEAETAQLDLRIARVDELVRTSEVRMSHNRERIAALETAVEAERTRIREFDEHAGRLRRQLAAMRVRAGDLNDQLTTAQAAIVDAEVRRRDLASRLADEERALTALTSQLDQIRTENEQRRATQLEEMRSAAALANELKALDAQLAHHEERRHKCQSRLLQLDTDRDGAAADINELRLAREELINRLDIRNSDVTSARDSLADSRRHLAIRQKELATWREKHSAAVERAAVLGELEKRLDGVSAGVKEVLLLAKQEPNGPFQQVRGMLADLLQANVESAALIEVALGEKAQHLVVAGGHRLREHLTSAESKWQGRVVFLPLDGPTPGAGVDLSAKDGVMGLATDFVETRPEFRPLVQRLLGRTWVVESLATALSLAESADAEASFVTLAGELVTGDGTIAVGPRHAGTGLISRRSELRALAAQITEWERKIAEWERITAELEHEVYERELKVVSLSTAHQQAADELNELRIRLNTTEQRRAQLDEQHQATNAEAQAAASQCETVTVTRATTRSRLEELQATLALTEARLLENGRRIEHLDGNRQTRSREAMTVKLGLARSEQQLDHLRSEVRRFEEEQAERQRALAEGRQQLADYQERIADAEHRVLSLESELADLYLHKESFSGETVRLETERSAIRTQRQSLVNESQRSRGRIRRHEEKLHKKELDAGTIRHERATLEARLREDYGIELAELTQTQETNEANETNIAAEHERAAIEEEIADLRRKLTNIGGVNVDSLQEADELEARFANLSSQYQDLSKAKQSLETIIGKINADSRRLFSATLETVKEHFQTLFRKLFGGGRADIILEEGMDILDSGIEIVARPPGKEPRNISLLSGGEKTLTCVALLLAIFRSRPSPFCVLDEVDAALDEANIERFVGVLNEFLEWTQFIVVTHSKMTMACANTLYGITMQESGISKRVSVRFEDVSDDGEIREEAIRRAEEAA